jgi:hypothetical protein
MVAVTRRLLPHCFRASRTGSNSSHGFLFAISFAGPPGSSSAKRMHPHPLAGVVLVHLALAPAAMALFVP